MSVDKQIANSLLAIGAVKLQPENPFTWASGWRSPIYCDNRILLSHPAVRNQVVAAFVSASAAFEDVEGIAGVATAGIAHGALLADRLTLPYIYVRSSAKAHGRQNLIEGQLKAGARYLVVEDLISTGGSALQACQALRAAGAEVAGVLAIFSYEFPQATQAFAKAAIPFATLSNYSALLALALEQGTIEKAMLATLQAWRTAPAEWGQ